MKSQEQGAAQQALEQESETLRDFISMAVHDLREPLRAIRAGSQLLVNAAHSASAEDASRGARYVQDGADRLELLIHDIAEYCYEEAREPDYAEMDLEWALLEAQKELAIELKSCEATVAHDPLPAVRGNFFSLVAVFRCLIGNACKFRSVAPPRIHVGAAQEAVEWTFSVRDNGMGFDDTYRERIFRPFEKLNGKQYPGSGLGLSLAKKIIERHGGRIWAESRPGEGSTIRFTLPGVG